MLSITDFDPKGTISEVRVHAGAKFGHTGCWSIAKCSQSSRRNYPGVFRSWPPATCRFSTRRFLITMVKETVILYTREMQGIVGQASDFKLGGQLSVCFERLSQRSTQLSCTRFDEERLRKSKASTSNVVVRFFAWTHQPMHEFHCRTCSGCRLAGMPGVVIVLDTACACQWEKYERWEE